MSTKIEEALTLIFKKFPKYWEDDNLIKNKVIDDLRNDNTELLSAIMKDEVIKSSFFINIDDNYIFQKDKLIDVLRYKSYWHSSYTKYANKIGLTSEDKYLDYNSDVVLDFPHKDCVLEGGMTKEDMVKDEVYYHNILGKEEIDVLLEPKVLTNVKRYDSEGECEVNTFSDNDSLIIKGNNLIALHSIKKRYQGKIQTIYIDPPFNTSNDSFKYNDRFNESTWLTFMKNRLDIAKKMLSDSGNIFIHIDNNESHILKVLCDEIFGSENFVEEYIWAYGSASGGRAAGAKPVNIHDYILHYAKNYSSRKQYKQYTPYSEKYIKDWFKYTDEDGRVYRRRHRGKDSKGENIWQVQYLDESKGVPLTSVWNDIQQVYANPQAYKQENRATSEIELEFGNSGQKPEKLLQRILNMSTDPGDIVLDFFLGSGSTAATAMKMNRRFIGIEQMESQLDIAVNRLIEVIEGKQSGISKEMSWHGGGAFIYSELTNLNHDVIDKLINSELDVSALLEELQGLPYINYKIDDTFLRSRITEEFDNLDLIQKKNLLIQVLDNNQLYLNYSEIDDISHNVDDVIKQFNYSFYEVD